MHISGHYFAKVHAETLIIYPSFLHLTRGYCLTIFPRGFYIPKIMVVASQEIRK